VPSRARAYPLAAVRRALAAAYGPALHPHLGVRCTSNAANGRSLFYEVRICLDRYTLQPRPCDHTTEALLAAPHPPPAVASHRFPPISAEPCSGDEVWLPSYLSPGTAEGDGGGVDDVPPPPPPPPPSPQTLSWGFVAAVAGGVAAAALLLTAGLMLLRRLMPRLFTPLRPVVVHYDLVQRPVVVRCEPVDMAALWRSSPPLAQFVEDLPVGARAARARAPPLRRRSFPPCFRFAAMRIAQTRPSIQTPSSPTKRHARTPRGRHGHQGRHRPQAAESALRAGARAGGAA
jgi:hypothetical protein